MNIRRGRNSPPFNYDHKQYMSPNSNYNYPIVYEHDPNQNRSMEWPEADYFRDFSIENIEDEFSWNSSDNRNTFPMLIDSNNKSNNSHFHQRLGHCNCNHKSIAVVPNNSPTQSSSNTSDSSSPMHTSISSGSGSCMTCSNCSKHCNVFSDQSIQSNTKINLPIQKHMPHNNYNNYSSPSHNSMIYSNISTPPLRSSPQKDSNQDNSNIQSPINFTNQIGTQFSLVTLDSLFNRTPPYVMVPLPIHNDSNVRYQTERNFREELFNKSSNRSASSTYETRSVESDKHWTEDEIQSIMTDLTNPIGRFLRESGLSVKEIFDNNLMSTLSEAPRKLRVKYGPRKTMTLEERRLLARERNREHAKATRERRRLFKKALAKIAKKSSSSTDVISILDQHISRSDSIETCPVDERINS